MAPARKKRSGGAKNKTAMVKTPKPESQPARDPYQDFERVLLQQCPPSVPAKVTVRNLPEPPPSSPRPSSMNSSDGRSTGKTAKSSYTIRQLIEKADEYIDSFEFTLAEKFCARAIEMDPNSSVAHSLHGSTLQELGRLDEAREAYRRAIELNPHGEYSAHLSYAQLLFGKDAFVLYRKAIEILKAELARVGPKYAEGNPGVTDAQLDYVDNLRIDLSSAYCAVAELYMTDLCDEPDAESDCMKNIKAAIDVDDQYPEGYQSMASYYLVKGEMERARAFMKQSLDLWLEAYKAAVEDADADENASGDSGGDFDPVTTCPLTFTARVACAKLCIELDMFDEGTTVLNRLLQEDDEDEEIWYLLGYSNYLRGDDHWTSARYFFKRAVEVMKKRDVDDPAMQKSIEDLLREIYANPKVPDSDDEEGDEQAVTDALNELELYSSDDEDDDDESDENEDDAAMASDKESGVGGD